MSEHGFIPTRRQLLDRMLLPFQRFLHAQSSSGIVLIVVTVIALVWANSAWWHTYNEFWHTDVAIQFGKHRLSEPLVHWINDALMAAFFFVVGLEIKREMLVGELASIGKATLPIAGAIGGMIVPAAIFAFVNRSNPEALRGWGVPMATDIAFALGILALLGDRVSLSAKIFLTALAIVDDIGAALVIALFYTEHISAVALGVGGVFLLAMIGCNKLGVRSPIPYALLGLGLWLSFLESGVHPTIAGILGAMAIPARTRINADEFVAAGSTYVDEFQDSGELGGDVLTNPTQRGSLKSLEKACELAQTPLQRLESRMHPWVMFAIMPLFALANAGVHIAGNMSEAMGSPVVLGIVGGLVIGKQLGITFFAWLAVRLGLARLPPGLTWRQVYGTACLGGIGFTMSLFVASLAYRDTVLLASAKVGILLASIVSGFLGWCILRTLCPKADPASTIMN